MADTCCTYTFGSVTVNPDPATDGLQITDEGEIEGLDGAPITRQIDPKGAAAGASGSITQDATLRGRAITFKGFVHIGTIEEPTANLAAYLAAVITLEKAVTAALEAQLNSATALAWTDSAGASRSIQAKYGMEGGEVVFSGPMLNRAFTFTLVTETPTITG